MPGRLPSITENDDARVLSWALRHDGELPSFTTEYTRKALVVAGWLTDGRLNEDGMEAAQRWSDASATVNSRAILGNP